MENPSGPGALSAAIEKTANLISSSENGLSNQMLFSELRDLFVHEENQVASKWLAKYNYL